MKIPTNNLFELIKAMSASEKRYYKRHYASEKNLTTDLFDFVNKMESYNEDLVKSNFKDTKLAKNLKVYKVQLTDVILKSLVSYYAKKTVKSKIRQGLEEIDLLLEKQLYEVALFRCKKIKELAIAKQELEYLIPILSCEIKLINLFGGKTELSVIEAVKGVISGAESTIELYQLKSLNFQLKSSNNKADGLGIYSENSSEARELLESLKIQEKDKSSFHIQFYKNSNRAIIQKLLLNNPEQELFYKSQNIQLFEQHDHLVNNNSELYFAAFYNYLVACRVQNKSEELDRGLVKIKKLISNTPALGRNMIYVYYLELKNLYELGQYSNIRDQLEVNVIEHVRKFKQENEHLAVLCFIYFALNNLILKDYHQVHFYLRRLFEKSKNLSNNYLRLFDIIELLSHLETKDFKVADLLISTLKRRTRTIKDPSSFYYFLLTEIRKMIRATESERQEISNSLLQKWDDFKTDEFYQLAKEFFLDDWKKALQKEVSIAVYKA